MKSKAYIARCTVLCVLATYTIFSAQYILTVYYDSNWNPTYHIVQYDIKQNDIAQYEFEQYNVAKKRYFTGTFAFYDDMVCAYRVQLRWYCCSNISCRTRWDDLASQTVPVRRWFKLQEIKQNHQRTAKKKVIACLFLIFEDCCIERRARVSHELKILTIFTLHSFDLNPYSLGLFFCQTWW